MPDKRTLSTPLAVWGGITLLILSSILLIGLRWGTEGFEIFVRQWIYTHLPTTLASVAITWFLAGVLTYLLAARKINAANALTWAGFFLIGFLYLNVLRERFRYGDIDYYIQSATRLVENRPLPNTYFYPPLWATLLKFILPLGEDGVLLVAWIFNVLAVFAFYFLLHRVLERYGFSPRLAALVTTGFMLVNTPLLRTLMYVQVNLHVMNAVFLSLLLYRRSPLFSALMLALAVQLKSSPAVLVLAFLLEWNWRWLAWFVLANLLLSSVTLLTDGITPFLDVLNNVTALAGQRTAVFHDNSFDSFLGFPTEVFGFSKSLARGLVYASKGFLFLAVLLVLSRLIRSQAFYSGEERDVRLFNAVIPLFIFMNLASPVVWVHHGIFLTLSSLLLLKRLDGPGQWMWFGAAYLLEFILPTFDFYPWSYGRLVAPLICLWLMWRVSRHTVPAEGARSSTWFERINLWLDSFPESLHAPS
jgi:hypothetical protein